MSNILVITFQDTASGEKAFDSLKELEKEDNLHLEDVVFVTRDDKGKLHQKETHRNMKKRGAASGGTVGFLVGALLGGPIGGALLGTAVGALAGKKIDFGVSQDKIDAVTAALAESQSALLIEANPAVVNKDLLKALIEQNNGTLHDLDVDESAKANATDFFSGTARNKL